MVLVIGNALPAMQLMCHFVVNVTTLPVNLLPSSIQTIPFPEGYVPYYDIGVAWKVHNTPVIHSIEARNYCAHEGAQLAVADTFKKVQYLLGIMPASEQWMHAGIIRVTNRWMNLNTGLTETSLPWASGEPSRNADCLFVHRLIGGLEDWGCINKHHFVCQVPIRSTNYVIPAK